MNTTKQEILNFLKEKTLLFIQTKQSECDTSAISAHLCLSRSLTSQYLNELVKAHSLIKIQERPVLFLNREVIETEYKFQFEDIYFEDTDQFFEVLNSFLNKSRNFSKAIGYDTSLKYCILQCQTAISFPPTGLPVILSGEPGCGKRFISKLMYEFAVDEKMIDKQEPFIIYECKKGVEHSHRLFGHSIERKLTDGLFQKAQKGILVIHHADLLSEVAKEKLANYIRTGHYVPVGELKAQKSQVRLILTTAQARPDWVNDILFRHIPIVINIPSLDERFPEDRKKFIYTFVKRETKNLNRTIYLSNSLFNTLMNFSFKRNIEQLAKAIQICCANAFQSSEKNNESLVLLQYHLPDDIISKSKYELPFSEDPKLINLDALNTESEINRSLFYYNKMIDLYLAPPKAHDESNPFYLLCTNQMNAYFDFLIFERKYANHRIHSIEAVLNGILDEIRHQYNLFVPANSSFIIARILYSLIYSSSQYAQWEIQNHVVNQFLETISSDYKAEASIVRELDFMIDRALDIHMDKMNQIFLILYIHFFNRDPKRKKILAIILSHGYSTASSIADAANRLIEKHIFEAIDMPLDTSVTEIVKILHQYFTNNFLGSEVILMVDMGSLENIGSLLHDLPNADIGIINNISTSVALQIGFMICENKSMDEILKTVCEATVMKYQIISNSKKETAIIFTTETGIASTDRVIQLFKNSLPKQNVITIVPYNYDELVKNQEYDDIFKKYHILFVTGTLKIELSNVPFIALEDIINFSDVSRINDLMKQVYTPEEIKAFNKNLMRNFSMENLINYITILNPEHLLDFVENAVKKLELGLNTTFLNKTRVGLYIHISCLIERLVTKTPITTFENLHEFELEHTDFIEQVKDSFAEIMNHYNVEIHVTEIAYLYAYIHNNNMK